MIAVGIYGIGYARHGLDGRGVQATVPLFVAAMLLVPAAGSVGTFLVCWELMALTSLLLVLAEHRHRAEVASAARWYAVMTHLGFVAILIGLLVLTGHADDDSFPALRVAASTLSPTTAGLVFVLTLIGFASKAGIVPLHAWLPRAHPEAPSHVSALMSAAMVTLGVYGIVRVGFDLLGGGAALVVAAGAGAGRGIGGLRDPAGRDRHRPQEAVGLLHHREHGPGPDRCRRRWAVRGGREHAAGRVGVDRRAAARDQPCRVQDAAVPRGRLGAARHRQP